MANFSDTLGLIETEIKAVFCDDALYRAASGGGDVPVRIKFRNPDEESRLSGEIGIVAARPTVKVAVSDIANVVKSDAFVFNARLYRVANAPLRPGRGRWWLCEVEDVGAA
jgi:hypothetical protein